MATMKLTVCNSDSDAEELCARLKEKGINADLHNRSTVVDVIPDIEVLVEEEQYDAAKEVLDQLQTERNEFMPWCPDCGSEDVSLEVIKTSYALKTKLLYIVFFVIVSPSFLIKVGVMGLGILIFLAIAGYVAFFRPHKTKRYTCKKCGKVFDRY